MYSHTIKSSVVEGSVSNGTCLLFRIFVFETVLVF